MAHFKTFKGCKVPTSHTSQRDDPAAAAVPTVHKKHAEAPSAFEARPDEQFRHCVWPSAGWLRPAAQMRHTLPTESP